MHLPVLSPLPVWQVTETVSSRVGCVLASSVWLFSNFWSMMTCSWGWHRTDLVFVLSKYILAWHWMVVKYSVCGECVYTQVSAYLCMRSEKRRTSQWDNFAGGPLQPVNKHFCTTQFLYLFWGLKLTQLQILTVGKKILQPFLLTTQMPSDLTSYNNK